MTLESILSDARKLAVALDPILTFVSIVQKATGAGGVAAEHAIQVITAAVDALEQSVTGQATKELTDARMASLLDEVSSIRQGARNILDERFGKDGG